MKKRFLVAAMAATMVSPIAAYANATVYGNVHLSIDDYDDDVAATNEELTMNSRTSAIGVKGKEDLGGGMSAIFKLEWQVAVDERNSGSGSVDPTTGSVSTSSALVDRDQWVGLKGAMGTVKFGTMSSNYKQMGGKVDPMYRTAMEGRAWGGQTNLHGGAGIDRGRSTNTVQYSSPKMGGMQLVLNTTFAGVDDETTGLGFRYASKNVMAYFDYIDMAAGTTTESAMKVGGTFKTGDLTLGLQHELTEDLKAYDVTFLSAKYAINDMDSVALTAASASGKTAADNEGSGFAIMYDHKMSKRTNVYAGYLSEDIEDNNLTDTNLSFGIKHKF